MFGFNEVVLSFTQNTYLNFLNNTSILYPFFTRAGDMSDGNLKPTSNMTLTKNVYQCNEVDIPSGVIVTAKEPGLLLIAKTVKISGLLTASGLGAYGGSSGGSAGKDGGGYVGGGGGAGGGIDASWLGGNGGKGRADGAVGSAAAGAAGKNDIDAFFDLASMLGKPVGGGGGGGAQAGYGDYGGRGGNGGGYLVIVCDDFILDGACRADGLNGMDAREGSGAGGGGGGGGGAIIIDCLTSFITGSISVAGGAGGAGDDSNPGGRGGDGYYRKIERRLL
jgi:hypothetical protein